MVASLTTYEHSQYQNTINKYTGTAEGKVLDVSERSPNLRIETFAKYRFLVNDTAYVNEEKLSVGLNYRPFLKTGDALLVHYDVTNPQKEINRFRIKKSVIAKPFHLKSIRAKAVAIFLCVFNGWFPTKDTAEDCFVE
jgi:hypothetical protein